MSNGLHCETAGGLQWLGLYVVAVGDFVLLGG